MLRFQALLIVQLEFLSCRLLPLMLMLALYILLYSVNYEFTSWPYSTKEDSFHHTYYASTVLQLNKNYTALKV